MQHLHHDRASLGFLDVQIILYLVPQPERSNLTVIVWATQGMTVAHLEEDLSSQIYSLLYNSICSQLEQEYTYKAALFLSIPQAWQLGVGLQARYLYVGIELASIKAAMLPLLLISTGPRQVPFISNPTRK